MITAMAQGPSVLLSNGIEMPQFGIGTFNVPSNEICRDAVLTALRAGYRHIDTAHAYMDEKGVGEAVNAFIAESGCKREDIWVTSK
ncbi:MAG: aldo/keto reductase, partial [Candidatus Cryptobacteroides sp.]